uniref:Uncharacterized protein n=1 Tax=Siphoviridae sp. ctzAk96 TaxID=2826527 RepID=A0A8S5QWH4_9CAUD|nr:MAG TPA: hypothetical protein [Siphoviridae sp. ctzAk96]
MAGYSILEQVKIRLKQYHMEETDGGQSAISFDDNEENPLIEQLIRQATAEVIGKRNYPGSYTEEQIETDLKNYESNIVNLVVYDHSQAGEEFMASFSENGVSRNWKSRDDLFVGIFPFAKVL